MRSPTTSAYIHLQVFVYMDLSKFQTKFHHPFAQNKIKLVLRTIPWELIPHEF
jgi:hypothetical protein